MDLKKLREFSAKKAFEYVDAFFKKGTEVRPLKALFEAFANNIDRLETSVNQLEEIVGSAGYVEYELTEAQILDWQGNDYYVLPDLGASKRYVITKSIVERPLGATAYTGGNIGQLSLIGAVNSDIIQNYDADMLLTNGVLSNTGYVDGTDNTKLYYSSFITNSGIRIFFQQGASNPTGGNGGLTFKIWYTVIDF
jgi:hypothetical protein